MNGLDTITNLALDTEPCVPSKLIEDACETHGTDMYGPECDLVVQRRQHLRAALNDLTPVLIDWLAGMVEGAAEEVGEDYLRPGMRGAASLIRHWDPWLEYEDA